MRPCFPETVFFGQKTLEYCRENRIQTGMLPAGSPGILHSRADSALLAVSDASPRHLCPLGMLGFDPNKVP